MHYCETDAIESQRSIPEHPRSARQPRRDLPGQTGHLVVSAMSWSFTDTVTSSLASKLSSGNRLVGAIVCCIVEANGFERTGKKRSIPVDGYSRGEVYTLNRKKAADWRT